MVGAAQGHSLIFVGEYASWIWDRIPRIVEIVKLNKSNVHEVLDSCHAVHHISLALAASGLTDAKRIRLFRNHRTLLRNGQWRQVGEELTDLSTADPENEEMQTKIAFLRRHGEAGRLAYVHFRRLGIPLGSGAVESSIRRVVNLRLKCNGMFWQQEHAESLLQVRAQVISNRWDERLTAARNLARRDGSSGWAWTPQPMSIKSECVSPFSE